MLDRTKAPVIHPIENVFIPDVEKLELPHGGKLFFYKDSSSETFKIELLSEASHITASNSSLCHLAIKMLKEGSKNKSGNELAEAFDSLGSFIEISAGFDHSKIAVYGLSKYFQQNLELLSELIYRPSFKPDSLDKLKSKLIAQLRVNRKKGSYLSSTNLRKSLFGEKHPYGFLIDEEQIQSVTLEEIKQFYKEHITKISVYLSGNLSNEEANSIRNYLQLTELEQRKITTNPFSPTIVEVRSKEFVQSSIKLGKVLFARNNPDYFPFLVLNETLGGFFGSRLMKVIREEKGLTYGIYSHLYALQQGGYFQISADVKGENETEVLDEIINQIKLLQSEFVGSSELETVKNYMIGSFSNSLASPFAAIEKFKIQNTQNLSSTFYKDYISNIKAVTKAELIDFANKYLEVDSFTKSIVGN